MTRFYDEGCPRPLHLRGYRNVQLIQQSSRTVSMGTTVRHKPKRLVRARIYKTESVSPCRSSWNVVKKTAEYLTPSSRASITSNCARNGLEPSAVLILLVRCPSSATKYALHNQQFQHTCSGNCPLRVHRASRKTSVAL